MERPNHLFLASDGDLYDTRAAGWSSVPALRPGFARHDRDIKTVASLKAALRSGPYAWPGGYPLFFVTSDGAALSFDAVRDNLATVMDSIANDHRDGWRVVAVDINHEDQDLYCDHTGKRIPSAYGEHEESNDA